MISSTCHIIVFIGSFLFFNQLEGQVIPLKKFDIGDGLPTNEIYRTIQDSKGNLWIGTTEGVSKYDGYTFKNFSVRDGLPSNDVFNVIEDLQGRIWLINNQNAIVYIKDDVVTNFDFESTCRISVIERTHDYTDLFNQEQIFRFYANDSLEIISKENQQKLIEESITIFDFFDSRKKIAPLYCAKEVFKINDIFLADQPALNRILVIHQDDTIEKHLQFKDFPSEYSNPFATFVEKNNAEFQLSCANYLSIYDSIFKQTQNYELQIDNAHEINSLFKDRVGNIWISSLLGLYLVDKSLLGKSILYNEKSAGLDISKIFEFREGKLLVTSSSSLYYEKNDTLTLIYLDKSGSKKQSFYDVELFDSNIYFSNREGMKELKSIIDLEFKLVDFQSLIFQDESKIVDLQCQLVKRIILYPKKFNFNRENIIFLSTRTDFFSFNMKTKIVTRLLNQYVDDFAVTESKCYLISEGKVYDFTRNTLEQILPDVSSPEAIHILSEKAILVHSENRESYINTEDTTSRLEFLSDKKIIKIITEVDNIWILHSDGIIEAKLNEDHTGLIPSKFHELRAAMHVNTLNDFIKNKDLFTIATNNGIFEVNLANWNSTSSILPIYIDSIFTSEESYLLDENINLPYDQNSISIAIKAISLSKIDNVTYHYRLLGAEKEFVETSSMVIRYPKLTPGKYTFEVYATDTDKGKSPIISRQINIKKPWYDTFLFFVFCGLSIASIFYYLYRRREKQLLQKAQSDQRFAELELNALQSQMNPHFVFNAMGSLQNLVQNKEVDIADIYIAKFAKMMRMFLEGSKHKFVSIQEEIEIVMVYYDLEKLRFQEKLSLVYENTLSPLQMQQEIPANLLQPFIENAINHGIFHKKKGGTIVIQLFDKGSEIEINIIDNGIGRAKAAEYKSKQDYNHKSRAIEILDEKIVAIQKLKGMNIEYEIVDLVKNGQACGTKVCLRLKNKAR
ncbi:histidine kinase [Saprospiraceae bacterium]|nr:histidine kinase [Saprospiraceae bacterium]